MLARHRYREYPDDIYAVKQSAIFHKGSAEARLPIKMSKKKSRARASELAPFFVREAQPAPLWRAFFPCLLLAFLLRIYAGGGDWLVRVDELFQYLEQAHRMVFGYGQVTWEFRMGARTAILPYITAAPMYLCKLLGFTHPDAYIPAVKAWHSLLSLSIPVGMYLFSRRHLGENAARLALLFGCFWHQFVLYGSHANAEQYGAEVFFLALALLTPAAGTTRLIAVGFLLGMTAALRLPYLPLVGIFGLILLTAYPPRRWLFVLAGGLGALVFWGFTDYLHWGRWWHSPRLYVDVIVLHDVFNKASLVPSPARWHEHFVYLMSGSLGLYALSLFSLGRWRRFWMLLALIGGILLFHTILENKEYSNVFIVWPMLWMLIAAAVFNEQRRKKQQPPWRENMPQITLAAALLVTIGLFIFGVPHYSIYSSGYYLDPRNERGLRSELTLVIARYLSRLPAEEVRAVAWLPNIDALYLNGGYYHIHHRVPLLFPSRIPFHKELLEENGDERQVASHLIAPSLTPIPGFTLAEDFSGIGVFTNDEPQNIKDLPDFYTDVLAPAPLAIEAVSKQEKIEFREPEPAWLYERSGQTE